METVSGNPLLLVTQAITRLEKCKAINEVYQLHAKIIKTNLVTNSLVLRNLVSTYCLHGLPGGLDQALSIFHGTQNPHDPFLYFALIKSLAGSSKPSSSLSLYVHMLCYLEDTKGLEFSLPSILKVCGRLKDLDTGKQIHAYVSKTHMLSDPFVTNSLIRMYSQSGKVQFARRVFDEMPDKDLISWNSMMTGYLQGGDIESARRLFDEMPERDMVSYNVMIDGYGKYGNIKLAEEIFGMAPWKDVKTWTSMMSAYVINGCPRRALEAFRTMVSAGVQSDGPALVTALSATADLGFLEEGKWIHHYIDTKNKIRASDGSNISSALINMYAKCGEIKSANRMFKTVYRRRKIGDYNSMISGLALHGLGCEALGIFREMQALSVEPDEITFVGLLNACSHGGLVDEGRSIFRLMRKKYKIAPRVQHYGCLIDMLGRAGHLEEALVILRGMPFEPDVMAWKAILSGSVKHDDVAIGEMAALRAIELEPNDSSSYVMLSNIYARTGRFDDVAGVRRAMRRMGLEKVPGCSSVRVGGKIETFVAGKATDRWAVEALICRARSEGYEPDLSQVLLEVNEEEKERLLSLHSEKIALAFGLINVRGDGALIRIVKNLRVCGDCHSFIKFVSRLDGGRRIIVRDQNRFHHFHKGVCSCNDYW